MNNGTNPSNEGSKSLYEQTPDTNKIDIVFTAVAEKNPEKLAGRAVAGTAELGTAGTGTSGSASTGTAAGAGASAGAAGSNTIVTETEIGKISTTDIRNFGEVVLAVGELIPGLRDTIKKRAEASKNARENAGREEGK